MLIIKGPSRVRCLYLIISSTWQFGHSISLHLFHTLAHSRFVASFTKSRSSHSYIVSYKKLLHLTPSFGISLINVVRGFSIKQTLGLCPCWLPSLASLRNTFFQRWSSWFQSHCLQGIAGFLDVPKVSLALVQWCYSVSKLKAAWALR